MKTKAIILVILTLIIGFFLGILTSAQIRHSKMKQMRSYVSGKDFGEMMMETIQDVGYRIAEYTNQASICEGKMLRGLRQVGRAFRDTAFIPIERIPESERGDTMGKIQRISSCYGMMRNALGK